jgi:hypothetical protein
METRRQGDAGTRRTGAGEDASSARGFDLPRVSAAARPRVFRALVLLCRVALVALWLFAAGAKIYTASDFRSNVASIIGARWAWDATLIIIACELLAALLLILPRTVRAGALASVVLLIGFAAFALFYVYVLKGEPLECGCFGGIIASQLGVKTALRNLALVVPALVVLAGHGRGRLR